MTTVNRTIETEYDKKMAVRLLESRPIPFTLSLADGKHRSTAQNKLQHMWMAEIAQQKGDISAEEARGYCKLTIGVPILRSQNAAFAKEYDKVVKPLPYEAKLKLMMVPFDFGVTRIMTTKQKTQYLDDIARHFGEQGIILTMPDDLRNAINSVAGGDPQSSPDDDATATQASSRPEETSPLSISSGQQIEAENGNESAPEESAAKGSPQANVPADSSTLFSFKFADGELVHLKDYARKALADAAGSNDTPAKEVSIERMRLNYLDAVESRDAKDAIEAMSKPLAAVIDGKRTRTQAANYIATELLGCSVSDLEGRR